MRPFKPIPEPTTDPEDPPRPRTNPRPLPPDLDPRLRPNPAPDLSFVESMGSIVDEARQLNTEFGLRPYRLHSVITKWTGGAKGRGDQIVVSEREVLPTPLMRPERLRGDLKQGGLEEAGTMEIAEISPRYTEDDIRALFHCQPLPDAHEGFLEMRIDQRDGCTIRRRFVIEGVPVRRAHLFDWVVRVRQQDPPRTREGQIVGTGMRT